MNCSLQRTTVWMKVHGELDLSILISVGGAQILQATDYFTPWLTKALDTPTRPRRTSKTDFCVGVGAKKLHLNAPQKLQPTAS